MIRFTLSFKISHCLHRTKCLLCRHRGANGRQTTINWKIIEFLVLWTESLLVESRLKSHPKFREQRDHLALEQPQFYRTVVLVECPLKEFSNSNNKKKSQKILQCLHTYKGKSGQWATAMWNINIKKKNPTCSQCTYMDTYTELNVSSAAHYWGAAILLWGVQGARELVLAQRTTAGHGGIWTWAL